MSIFISIIVFLIVFSVLILIHEWGHFYAARRAGVKVEEFGMGLPPRAKGLFTDKKGTLYSLNWIPFGGFVRMYGEDSSDPKLWQKEGSFGNKSIPWRTIIILGGVIMNFLLGFVLLVIVFTAGSEPFVATADDFKYYRDQGIILAEDHVLVGGFAEDSLADEAGLKSGDEIIRVSGTDIAFSSEVIERTQERVGQDLELTVLREGEEVVLSIPVNEEGRMGVQISDAPEIIEVKKLEYTFPEAVKQAGYETGRLSYLTMKMFADILLKLFTQFEVSDQVSGPVGIASITHDTVQTGNFIDILKLLALLSISLGAINVLPIPALDGGRFLSIIFEVITRKRPNAAWEARIHAIGFLIIIILIFAVTYNDIVKLIAG